MAHGGQTPRCLLVVMTTGRETVREGRCENARSAAALVRVQALRAERTGDLDGW